MVRLRGENHYRSETMELEKNSEDYFSNLYGDIVNLDGSRYVEGRPLNVIGMGDLSISIWGRTLEKHPIHFLDNILSGLIIGRRLWLKISLNMDLNIMTVEFWGNVKSYNSPISLKGSTEQNICEGGGHGRGGCCN